MATYRRSDGIFDSFYRNFCR